MKLMILVFFLSLQSFAQNAKDSVVVETPEVTTQLKDSNFCPRKTSRKEFEQLIYGVQTKYFANELHDVDVSIKEFRSKNYFLQARPEIKTLFNKSKKRRYFIMLNPNLYECSPSLLALEGILIHEFQHIVDYKQASLGKFIRFTKNYVLNKKFHANYEQETDMQAIARGAGEGLIEYREWIYLRLSAKNLKKKIEMYLSPLEIKAVMDHLNEFN